jgi:hypothetical protein
MPEHKIQAVGLLPFPSHSSGQLWPQLQEPRCGAGFRGGAIEASRERDQIDDFVRHGVDDQHLALHLDVGVVAQSRNLLRQRSR